MRALIGAVLSGAFLILPANSWKPDLTPEVQAALNLISTDSLRADVTYLASDELEGRNTPSPGLDKAADYIAERFKEGGVAPGVQTSYFQETTWRNTDTKVRNVIGVLPGTDPLLKDTYVILSAHYDHVGVNPRAEGDQIFNGANDDASGTAGVVEIARAFAKAGLKPKRTIVFALWYGEEKGLVGSRYYGDNPVFPINKTVALVNLEMIGRTDDVEGEKLKSATMTGFDYSEVPLAMSEAGKALGIEYWKHEQNSDSFFGRSDNRALALKGVPAHALSTTFVYPDYHKAGDHADKLDYENMTAVTKAIALGIWTLANSDKAPEWNAENPNTERYRAARAGGG